MEEERKKAGRLVIVLWPFQGHINPMLQLATILNSKGFSITIVHPEFNSPKPFTHPEFTFRSIPDKLSESNVSLADFPNLFLTLSKNCLAPLQQCMDMILHDEKDSNGHVAGIIYDTLMYSAQSVADHLGLPGISVRTSSAATMLSFAAFPHRDGKGYSSFQDSVSEDQMLEPDLEFLQLRHLHAPKTSQNPTDAMSELIAVVTHATKSSSAILVNSMDFLEQAALSKIKEYFPPILTIGPLHKLAPTRNSLLKEDTDCLSWLNKQALKSVLYVSFGSVVCIDEKELIETAWGLANSEQPFLWVVRPGLVRGSEWIELLPNDFQDRVGERGCIVKWAPQTKVLEHGAVGGFWSHCGWNSTLESVSQGVPMLCRPFVADQFMNSGYICRIWKVGLELENKLERGKIQEAINRLMVDAEGEEIRKNAMDFKVKTELCLTEGGSSCNHLNDFVKLLS